MMSVTLPNRIALWIAVGTAELECLEIRDPVVLRDGAACPLNGTDSVDGEVTLQVVQPLDGIVAVAYVGTSNRRPVALNGVPLGCGMHAIHSTDRLDVGADAYWLSEDLTPQRTCYDPLQHGDDVRCCMTKARLHPGQDIVVCPGRLGVPCQVIYKAAAWDALIQSDRGMKCPSCGYEPQQAAWSPPEAPLRKKSFDEFHHFAHK